ncbi:alpha carbonic anhydrase 1, chloroplastic-like [Silene latifolia]|uniref:alpha carbonic anhydrase 1, chloroplastic-like n=1 Tax=Silene latifolia TaxID=37657 RepID=UPI003D76D2EA
MYSTAVTLFLGVASFLLTVVLSSGEVEKFNYSDPWKWGSESPENAICSSGKQQSPIDIITSDVFVNETLKPLTRDYHVYNASLATNGIQVEVVFRGRGELVIDGKTYYLKQMHWHTPSEHRLNGVQYAAELHQVHAATDGSRTVVGILFKYGPPSALITMLKPQLDELAKQPCEGSDQHKVVPRFESLYLRRRPRNYYRYLGSLTTPPCDENILWNVLAKVKTISKDQVEALKAPLCKVNQRDNARPIQALNGRRVQLYDKN